MKITFLGGAGCVTGSRFLVDSQDARVLVDCGLFQGYKHLRLRNREPFPVPPKSIHAVLLTHAHIDHSGYLPALVRKGFAGPIHASPATHELAKILLPDSARLQEEDAQHANAKGYSKHHPARPLYNSRDAQRALNQIVPTPTGRDANIAGLTVRFIPNGHILGSCAIVIDDGNQRIAFSGDLGRPNDILMPAPEPVGRVDRLVVEATYGDRRHGSEHAASGLTRLAAPTLKQGGVVLIPTFAVGRAQALLVLLHRLMATGAIPHAPIVLDSPMAVKASRLLFRHANLTRLEPSECRNVEDGVEYITTVDESKALAQRQGPLVLLSASGMLTGGRVLHHFKRIAPQANNTILFAGHQAGGTRGGHLLAGHQSVKVHGQTVQVRAALGQIPNLSAHADYTEIGHWLDTLPFPPALSHIVHGEPPSLDALRFHLESRGWNCHVPYMGESSGTTGTKTTPPLTSARRP